MLSPEAMARLARYVVEEMEEAERLDLVAEMDTAEELRCLIHDHNWDDGFAIPTAIIDHPACDLGLALQLFWLADGITWTRSDGSHNQSGRAWNSFCQRLSERILSGSYPHGEVGFDPGLNRVAHYKLQKQGVPPIFFTAFEGNSGERE